MTEDHEHDLDPAPAGLDAEPTGTSPQLPGGRDTGEQQESEILATRLLRPEDAEVPRESQHEVRDWLNRVDPVERDGTDATGGG